MPPARILPIASRLPLALGRSGRSVQDFAMMKILTLASILLVLTALVFAAFHYMTVVPGRSHTGPLPALGDDEAALAARLRKHIEAIATGPHNLIHYAALEEAARYIEGELRSLGYEPATQVFHTQGKAVRNIEATIEPSDPARFRGTVVLGAHYDSYGDAPGANDNGTGAAAVIELARRLIDLRNAGDLRIRLVLFVNEEPPYFKTDAMGSLHYARLLAERREPVIGMISLETLGCFNDVPGSQRYPAPFGLLYPSEGNFVAFVATLGSRKLLHALIESFRRHTAFPTVGGVAPGLVPGHRLVGPLVVRAIPLSGDHAHRHCALPLSALPLAERHAGQGGHGKARAHHPRHREDGTRHRKVGLADHGRQAATARLRLREHAARHRLVHAGRARIAERQTLQRAHGQEKRTPAPRVRPPTSQQLLPRGPGRANSIATAS